MFSLTRKWRVPGGAEWSATTEFKFSTDGVTGLGLSKLMAALDSDPFLAVTLRETTEKWGVLLLEVEASVYSEFADVPAVAEERTVYRRASTFTVKASQDAISVAQTVLEPAMAAIVAKVKKDALKELEHGGQEYQG